MELIHINGYFVTYQRQGANANGNPIFLVNVFELFKGKFLNISYDTKEKHGKRLDKCGNIRIQSYNIEQSIKDIISKLNNV